MTGGQCARIGAAQRVVVVEGVGVLAVPIDVCAEERGGCLYLRRRPRCGRLAWIRRRCRRGPDGVCRPRWAEGNARRSSRVIPGLFPRPSTRGRHGPHVEHADVAADGGALNGDGYGDGSRDEVILPRISFWDALVVQAAQFSGAARLFVPLGERDAIVQKFVAPRRVAVQFREGRRAAHGPRKGSNPPLTAPHSQKP
jgi:hypothetical protein